MCERRRPPKAVEGRDKRGEEEHSEADRAADLGTDRRCAECWVYVGSASVLPDGGTILKEVRKMDNKEKELLRQQLELLAERSKNCDEKNLAVISNAMVAIYSVLSSSDFNVL